MSTESKNHHYNPQSVLKRFRDGNRKLITLDKVKLKTFPASIEKSGSENHFNTIKFEDFKLNFEEVFDLNDSNLARLLDKILLDKTIRKLTDEEIYQLSVVVSIQLIRTKRARTEALDIVKKVNEFTKEISTNSKIEINPIPELNNEQSKIITLIKLSEVQSMADQLMSKDIVLLTTKENNDFFWTSDHPVVMTNSFDYGRIGINQKGIEIYYPISLNFAIGYSCKSIRYKYSAAKKITNVFDNISENLKSKGTIECETENVDYLNRLQVTNSSRFVYSPTNNFEETIEFLIQNPQFKNIESKIKSGSSLKNGLLPMGEWLVVYTERNHFKISIYEVKSEEYFEFKTNELNKFILLTNNCKIENIEYYFDQSVRRGAKDMTISSIDTKEKKVTLNHSDPAIDFLIKQIKKQKKENRD